jgi:hypothetical protein
MTAQTEALRSWLPELILCRKNAGFARLLMKCTARDLRQPCAAKQCNNPLDHLVGAVDLEQAPHRQADSTSFIPNLVFLGPWFARWA